MSTPVPVPRAAVALAPRERRVKDMLQRIEATVAELRHRHTAVTFQVVARTAGVSRTFLYENPEARKLIEVARERGEGASRPERHHGSEAETAWRERALNAEDRLKTRTRRSDDSAPAWASCSVRSATWRPAGRTSR
ncbi:MULTISPECIES: DUF6262 family protein [Streptomyces]|uniref:DUF6262 family protein n=1 Tax=Streptomyces tendae TaxID=1932 RepID=UPI0038239DEE